MVVLVYFQSLGIHGTDGRSFPATSNFTKTSRSVDQGYTTSSIDSLKIDDRVVMVCVRHVCILCLSIMGISFPEIQFLLGDMILVFQVLSKIFLNIFGIPTFIIPSLASTMIHMDDKDIG
jgi:hypothetical protein